MTDPQPEAQWVFPAERRRSPGKVAFIVVLIVLVLTIAGVLLYLFYPRGEAPAPTDSPTTSDTAAPTQEPTEEPTPEPTETETVTPEPSPSDPPAPGVTAFAEQVKPLLDDAGTGLGFAEDSSGAEGLQIVDTLRLDAERLAETLPPDAIATNWRAGVAAYASRLQELNTAFANGSSTTSALQGARSELAALRTLVGL